MIAAAHLDLLDLAQRVAGWAGPGKQVEAFAVRARQTSVRAFDGDVESVTSAASEGIGVRVISGHRQGFAYSASLDEIALKTVLEEATDNAEFGTPDEWLGLSGPDDVDAADLSLHDPTLGRMDIRAKVDMALELERAVKASDSRVRAVDSAVYGDSESETAIASTAGVNVRSTRSRCWLVADAIAGRGGETQTGSGYSVARGPDGLSVGLAAADAAHRATRLLGARKPPSQRLTVFLEPRVTSSLLGFLAQPVNGESVLKGRSPFAGRLGESIAVPSLTLVDDPTDAEAAGSSPYDAEGMASRRNVLIRDGVLASFLHNTYTGRRSGAGSNGSAVRGGFKSAPGVGSRALSFVPGRLNHEQLLGKWRDGLVVQSIHGLHSGSNPVSGDLSVGVEGLMVRDGVLGEPIREATMASNLTRILQDVVDVGSDLEWGMGGAAGMTLVVKDITLSGS